MEINFLADAADVNQTDYYDKECHPAQGLPRWYNLRSVG